jgi:hypothetical protein
MLGVDGDVCSVICDVCRASGPFLQIEDEPEYETEAEYQRAAIERWNRRAGEELREAREHVCLLREALITVRPLVKEDFDIHGTERPEKRLALVDDVLARTMSGTQSSSAAAVPPEARHGIRITYVNWGTVDGGPDLVGTKQELDVVAAHWAADAMNQAAETVTYDVVPYDGVDPAGSAEVDEFLARETKERR